MLNLNRLKVKTLITVNEVLLHAPVSAVPDIHILSQSIILAERRFIKPMLGVAVYDELLESKNILVTSANIAAFQSEITAKHPQDGLVLMAGDYINSDEYLSVDELVLWRNYLHKIVSECVLFCALPYLRSQVSKAGVTQENPRTQIGSGGATTIDLKDLKHLMDSTLQDRIAPLVDDLHAYMYRVNYAGYVHPYGTDDKATQTTKRPGGIMLSMYEEDEDNCRCKPFNAFG